MNRFFTAMTIVLAVVGLTGCAGITDGPGTMAPDCDGIGVCKVDVAVRACMITVTPSTVVIKAGARNVNISWELVPTSEGSYRFRDPDGIAFKTNPGGEFTEPGVTGGGKKFKINDKNTRPGRYDYAVNLQVLHGSTWSNCGPLDPTIVNQG